MSKYSWNVRGNTKQLLKRGKPITQKSLKKLKRRSANKNVSGANSLVAPKQNVGSVIGQPKPPVRTPVITPVNPPVKQLGWRGGLYQRKPLLQKDVVFRGEPERTIGGNLKPLIRDWR